MTSESNVKFFDDLAGKTSSYLDSARMFSFSRRVFDLTFLDIEKKLELAPADIVCDLGGGTGRLAARLANKCQKVILADAAPAALESARRRLSGRVNVSYQLADIRHIPLPFAGGEFSKVFCYSVVHYLESYEQFSRLVEETLRITRPGGRILIGDIPLAEKYSENMRRRRLRPFKNFWLNSKYYFKRSVTFAAYWAKGVDASAVHGLQYVKSRLEQILSGFPGIKYVFLEQDNRLPSADSREDLLIIKKT